MTVALAAACSPAPSSTRPSPPATASSALAASPQARPAPPLEVAVTVDDLPTHGPAFAGIDRVEIAERLLAAFRAHKLPPVYGFVNGKKVDDEPASLAVLQRWVGAGHPLGNHTYSHPSLNAVELADYLADIDRGEEILRRLVPGEAIWKVYRYPFLFEGPTMEKREGVRRHLAARRYAVAEVTIDGDDWAWNPPFARCSDRGDRAALAELRRGYVETHVSELRYVREATRALAGRDVKHVLLLHIGAADADAIDELLTAYEREGVRFIDLPAAMADPFYAEDPARPSRAGAALPYQLAKARGVALPPAPKRLAEEALEGTCR
ncbi:MAG TPA: polysaccharide deacetylase family protein [Polyangiaceae bacterium]|nr:polysaccharide deacetylase family protein [Polyangiaceae bacterium]